MFFSGFESYIIKKKRQDFTVFYVLFINWISLVYHPTSIGHHQHINDKWMFTEFLKKLTDKF